MQEYRVGAIADYMTSGRLFYHLGPVDRHEAERIPLPHGCAFCLIISPAGELLRTRRTVEARKYPGHYGAPGGHLDVLKDRRCETPGEAAVRELREETELEPLGILPYLSDRHLYDPKTGHVSFVYLMPVGPDPRPVLNMEFDPRESGFETPEIIRKKLDSELWTPTARFVAKRLIASYPTRAAMKQLYLNLLSGPLQPPASP